MCYVLRVVNNENYQSGCKQRRVPQKKTTKNNKKKRKKILHPRVVCYKLWKELMGERCATLWGTPTMKIINLHLSKGGSCKKAKQKKKNFLHPVFFEKNYEQKTAKSRQNTVEHIANMQKIKMCSADVRPKS